MNDLFTDGRRPTISLRVYEAIKTMQPGDEITSADMVALLSLPSGTASSAVSSALNRAYQHGALAAVRAEPFNGGTRYVWRVVKPSAVDAMNKITMYNSNKSRGKARPRGLKRNRVIPTVAKEPTSMAPLKSLADLAMILPQQQQQQAPTAAPEPSPSVAVSIFDDPAVAAATQAFVDAVDAACEREIERRVQERIEAQIVDMPVDKLLSVLGRRLR